MASFYRFTHLILPRGYQHAVAKLRRCCFILLCFLLSGCSFHTLQPAPVESLSTKLKPTYDRGSIKSSQYKVKKGDTLYSIAWGANKNFIKVARINNLTKPYTIYPGQMLKMKENNGFNKNKSVNKLSVKIIIKPKITTKSLKSSRLTLVLKLFPVKLTRQKNNLIKSKTLRILLKTVKKMLTILFLREW